MSTPQIFCAQPVAGATPTPAGLLTPADVGRVAVCHPNTTKKIADALRMDVARTAGGCRLFTPAQAERIKAELERRRREACR